MSVKWTVTDNTIEDYEGSEIDRTFSCSGIPESGNGVRLVILSSTLPLDINTTVIRDISNITGFKIHGVLPQISSESEYYVTARLEEYPLDNTETVIEYADKYFKIINKETSLEWTKQLIINCYESSEFSFSIKDATYEENGVTKKYINGLNGDEIFRKISGSMPSTLSLSSTGVISGIPLREDVGEDFTFYLALYRESNLVLEPTPVKIVVNNERKDIPPTWITESGILDTINAGDEASNIKAIAIINSDDTDAPIEKRVFYRIVDGTLPTGLRIETFNNQCLIKGTLITNEIADWNFTIEASRIRIIDGQEVSFSDNRSFYIKTNEASPEHKIDWNGDDRVISAGTYTIGTIINEKLPKAVAADGSVVKYMIIDTGDFPSNITISSNGTISGIADFPKGTFECTVRAYTDYTYITKPVTIKIIKGLGYNSLDLSLRINLEYKSEFLDIKNQLDTTSLYGLSQDGYDIDVFPRVNIATLSCFDREVLAGMFNFGCPEIIRFLETRYKTYSDLDVNGDPIETYEAYYKAVDEQTYQWDEFKNGNFDFQSEMEKEIEETRDFTGSVSTPYFYPMEYNAELDFNNETATPNPAYQKQWIPEAIPGGEVFYKIGSRNIETGLTFKVFNIKNVRKMLQKNVYVYRKTGDYYFDLGNQQLFEKDGISVKKLYEREEITNTGKEIRTYISDIDGSNEREVTYKEHIVFDNTNEKIYDTLFVPDFDTHPFMISSENDEIYNLEEISNPYCFDFSKEENKWISMDKIPDGKEMVLPRITADDLEEDGKSFIMLDVLAEPLPKWKRKNAKYWEAETTFNVDDIIYYDSTYYLIIKKYTSGYGFIYDEEYMRELSNDEVQLRLSKEYIPSLDLGYFKPGKNRVHLRNLNIAEKQRGEFWYRKDFMFWDITCTPLYNSTIETFGVPFYSTENEEGKQGTQDRKTFELIVNTPDADTSIIVDGIDIVTAPSDIKEKYSYIYENNSYKITVDYHTLVEWSVSAGEGYYSQSGSNMIVNDTTYTVDLKKRITLTINPTPSDALVELTAPGYHQEGNKISVPENTIITYSVSKDGYEPVLDQKYVAINSETLSIVLTKVFTLTVVPEPDTGTAEIIMTAPGYQQEGRSITVPVNTNVSIFVRCGGYFDKEVNVIVTQTETITIPLESTTYTYNLISEQTNQLISEQIDTLISEVYVKEHPINNSGD